MAEWGYVIAGYALTAASLAIYGAALLRRARRVSRKNGAPEG